MIRLFPVLLFACATVDTIPSAGTLDDLEPLEMAAPPPVSTNMTAPAELVRGQSASFSVLGGPANRVMVLVASTNQSSQPACPSQIAPECLGLSTPFVVVGNTRTDMWGTAEFTLPIPAGLSPDEITLQAVAISQGTVYLSQTATLDVLDQPVLSSCFPDNPGIPQWDLCEEQDDWRNALTYDCPNNRLQMVFHADAWSYGADVYIADTRFTVDYDEQHTMVETAASATPSGFTTFELDLETNVPFSDIGDGRSLFPCDSFLNHTNSGAFSTTFAVVTYTDVFRTTVADCIVFGDAPDELLDNNVVGSVGQSAFYSYPSWLNRSNCRAVLP